MAVSGTTTYEQTWNQLILDAFQLLGVYGIGRTVSNEDMVFASSILTKMLKSWVRQGLHLWTKQEGMLFLNPYQGEYTLGNYNNFAMLENTTTTQLTNNQVIGDTIIVVNTTEGMSVGNNIGIVLTNSTLQWTTISNINVDGVTLTLTDALTQTAPMSNLVYTTSAVAAKPLRVLSARLIQGFDTGLNSSQVELPMTSMAYEDYWNMAVTTSNSAFPNQFHYNPKVNNGYMYVWPRPTTAMNRIQITYERQIDDLGPYGDTIDFPGEWLEPITFQLAIRIGPAFGRDQRATLLAPMAENMLSQLIDWDNEITSIRFIPDRNGGGYK